MNDMPMFYQKNGWAVVKLARDLLNMEEGDRLPSVSQYAEEFNAGRGTIQYALKFLLDHGCMTLHKYGPKGSFISSLNAGRLWEYSDWGTLLCATPGVIDKTVISLLSGIHANLQEQQVPFNFVMMTNSGNRLRELNNNRYHFVVTTRLAMRAVAEQYPNLEVLEEVAGGEYIQPYALFHHQEEFTGLQDGMRLVVNYPHSTEQGYIADILCEGKNIVRMNRNHQDSTRLFESGEADLLIARPVMARFEGNCSGRFESLSYLGLDEDSTTPVIVANAENYGMIPYLRKRLSGSKIAAVQREVLDGRRRPSFY